MTIPILTAKKPLTEGQEACVELLEEALEQARQGRIYSVGVVVCMETGYATVMAGPHAADLNMGCDSLKKRILDAVEEIIPRNFKR